MTPIKRARANAVGVYHLRSKFGSGLPVPNLVLVTSLWSLWLSRLQAYQLSVPTTTTDSRRSESPVS